ncbi:MAG: hypothetical protein NC453_21460 [Muribaculum sp.]|nr:hypothetical protein [Muribaculum sp.]
MSLYGKMVITTIITLYLTRVVLLYLGENDFGIYSLIGGIIALLSFVNSALMVSTQRYLSVAIGEKSKEKLETIFSLSVLIHIGLAIFLIGIFELCATFLFNGFLNMAPQRIGAAKIVYQLMIASTIFTVVGVPYNAIINAKEDLWFFSIVETICTVLKLGILIIFHFSKSDALINYTLWMVVVTIVNFIIKYVWCKSKYSECRKIKYTISGNTRFLRELLSFSGWNAFGTLALVGRNQGVAIILNHFWGTAINAVYGIANQVNSQLIYFSTIMTTSMTPQIMKSYGEGNHRRMLDLSVLTCKIAFFMSAVFAIPLIIEMQFVLKEWLKIVPEYTDIFCTLIIYIFLVMQLSPGLDRLIQACGRIRFYQVSKSIVLLLPIPAGAALGSCGLDNQMILYAMIASQCIQLIISIIVSYKLAGLNVSQFIVFLAKAVISFLAILLCGKFIYNQISSVMNEWLTFLIVTTTTMIAFTAVYYLTVLNNTDKQRFSNLFKSLKLRK